MRERKGRGEGGVLTLLEKSALTAARTHYPSLVDRRRCKKLRRGRSRRQHRPPSTPAEAPAAPRPHQPARSSPAPLAWCSLLSRPGLPPSPRALSGLSCAKRRRRVPAAPAPQQPPHLALAGPAVAEPKPRIASRGEKPCDAPVLESRAKSPTRGSAWAGRAAFPRQCPAPAVPSFPPAAPGCSAGGGCLARVPRCCCPERGSAQKKFVPATCCDAQGDGEVVAPGDA